MSHGPTVVLWVGYGFALLWTLRWWRRFWERPARHRPKDEPWYARVVRTVEIETPRGGMTGRRAYRISLAESADPDEEAVLAEVHTEANAHPVDASLLPGLAVLLVVAAVDVPLKLLAPARLTSLDPVAAHAVVFAQGVVVHALAALLFAPMIYSAPAHETESDEQTLMQRLGARAVAAMDWIVAAPLGFLGALANPRATARWLGRRLAPVVARVVGGLTAEVERDDSFSRWRIRSIPLGCLLLIFISMDLAYALPFEEVYRFLDQARGSTTAIRSQVAISLLLLTSYATLTMKMRKKYLEHCQHVGIVENPQPIYWVLILAAVGGASSLFVWVWG